MNKRAKAKAIGTFIIGAIVILVILLFVINDKHRLTERTYVLYFRGSLKGLKVGSPVTHRGIKIGEVTRVDIIIAKDERLVVPIYIQFLDYSKADPDKSVLDSLIQKGFRARLQTYTLVPNVDSVELGYFPKTKVRLIHDGSKYLEIPTIASGSSMDEITEILASVKKAINNANKLISSPETKLSMKQLSKSLTITSSMLGTMNNNMGPVMVNLNSSLKELSKSVRSIGVLSDYLEQHPESLIKGKG